MIFEQFYLACLSHASYLIGDETTGRAVVVDPQRDIGDYLAAAEARGLHIERVIETHVHADFVSGHLELAARTGAAISYGEAVGETAFPVDPLADGQRLSLGSVELEILATPGHTPESISVVVREHPDDPPSRCSPATRCSSATSGAPICSRRRAPTPTRSRASCTTPSARGC